VNLQAFDLVRQLAASHYLVRSLHVAAELGVADAVVPEGSPIEQIAAKVGAVPDPLFRIIRLLASRGIFSLDGDLVTHTPASELLKSGHPASLRSFVRMFGQRFQWECAGDLGHSVTTGEAAASRRYPDGGLWGYFTANPDDGRVFGEAMTAKSVVEIADVLDAYDFSAYAHVVDIGGGHGHMLRAILNRHPNVTGTLFDLPSVVENAESLGLSARLEFVPGDFFTTPLPTADLMILMEVLHDWDDEHCAQILAAVRRSARRNTRLLVIEIEMKDGPRPDWPKLLDIVMLAAFAARQRTNAEYATLLHKNGFKTIQQISAAAGMTLIEAMPA
jgi:hypothetical protein